MEDDDQRQDSGRAVARQQLGHDFSLMLEKVIETAQRDQSQFRNLIYEMARVQLQREAWQRNPPMNILEMRRMMLALETAIERVETQAAQRDGLPLWPSSDLVAALEDAPSHDAVAIIDEGPARLRPRRLTALTRAVMAVRDSASLGAIVRLGALALLAAAVVIGLDREFHLVNPAPPVAVAPMPAPASGPPATQAAVPPAQTVMPTSASSGPLPDVYGVYAISGGKLYELESLAGRVPDPRVFMSAVLKTPSHTLLPDGDVSFIVYRRDIASGAPDRVTVRVIAQVARAMTFTKSGQPVTAKIEGEWSIRNVSFDYRVAPSSDSPEMILIKPETGAAPLAPGRYALVIKGQMFDFTVDGPIAQTAHCLERTEAMNGSFYSECRQVR